MCISQVKKKNPKDSKRFGIKWKKKKNNNKNLATI